MSTKRYVLKIPGPNAEIDYSRIQKGKGKTWPDAEYELSVETVKVLKQLIDYHQYTPGFVVNCYCRELICNDWDNIRDDMVLRPCSYCTNIVDIAIMYASGKEDEKYLKKRIFRFKRFDNFDKAKMIHLANKFKALFQRDINNNVK